MYRKRSLWWRNIAALLWFPGRLEPFTPLALEGCALQRWHSAGRGGSASAANCSHHIPPASSEAPLSHHLCKGKHSCIQPSSCCAFLCLARIMCVYRLTQNSVEENSWALPLNFNVITLLLTDAYHLSFENFQISKITLFFTWKIILYFK